MTGRYTTLFRADTQETRSFSLGWDLPEDVRQFGAGFGRRKLPQSLRSLRDRIEEGPAPPSKHLKWRVRTVP